MIIKFAYPKTHIAQACTFEGRRFCEGGRTFLYLRSLVPHSWHFRSAEYDFLQVRSNEKWKELGTLISHTYTLLEILDKETWPFFFIIADFFIDR